MHEHKVSLRTKLRRVCFAVTWALLCRIGPRQLSFLRCFVVKVFGGKVGRQVVIYGSVKIWDPSKLSIGEGSCLGPGVEVYSVDEIRIGRSSIISQNAKLYTASHNFRDRRFPLVARDIEIGDYCWVGASAFVGPGVRLSDHVIIGAVSGIFTQSLIPPGVYGGNPAKRIGEHECIQFSF